ncbi:MAG TPA: hypothetical protein VJ600_02090 [Holophagaceae bacterium]|nr:hypothetical protein [Holophagaceae bacterium]
MKRALLCIGLLMVGCTPPVTHIDIPALKNSESVVVKDLRPDTEKQSTIFSLSIMSKAYGTYRKGDEVLDPPMIQVLRHRVFEKFGASQGANEIKVHHLVIYLNAKSALRKGVFGGAIGAAVAAKAKVNLVASLEDPKAFDELTGESEYKRALYTEQENPDKASVYVMYLDAEINGKRVFVKTMSPTAAPDKQNALTLAVESTVKYYLDQY